MGLSDKDLILIIVLPIFAIFLFFVTLYLIYYCKCCRKIQLKDEDNELLLSTEPSSIISYSSLTQETTFINKNDINLIEKVKIEKLKKISESRDAAFVFLQFFIRSNPSRVFKSIDHLQSIGSRLDRNWVLIKETISDKNKYKLLLIDLIDSKWNKKQTNLLQIAESMSLSRRQMECLIKDFFKQIKHPNVLIIEAQVNFDKNRALFIQDYSRDGSIRDTLCNVQPTDEWNLKIQKNNPKNLFYILTIKNFGKQILSGLMYLRHILIHPVYNLHSGNIILAYNKRLCLITGYENFFFSDKNKNLNDDKLKNILKIYLIKNEQQEIRKAKHQNEIKQILEVLRFGFIIIEMCTGIETSDNLIPGDDVIQLVRKYQEQNENSEELLNFINFIFFNKIETPKKKCLIPSLNELSSHKFFDGVKFNDEDTFYSKDLIDPDHLELLQYLNGTLKIKEKKRKKSIIKKIFSTDQTNQVYVNTASIIPPSPPFPLVSKQPSILDMPLASPTPTSNAVPKVERSALLGDIRKGAALKKTVTVDKSKPMI